jgi:uncharacterized protein YcaQ
MAAIRRLECVQIDPVSLVDRNHHLVLRSRVGGYRPEQLDTVLASGQVFEHWANARCFLPVEEYPVFWWRMRHFAKEHEELRKKLGGVPERIVAEIHATGPRTSRQIESDEKVVGYWDSELPKTKATSLALELLWECGELMIARREGAEKVYDLAERIVSEVLRGQTQEISEDEALRALLDKYCRAFGLFDLGDFRFGWRKIPASERRTLVDQRLAVGELVPVEIEGVRRKYYALGRDEGLLRRVNDPELEVVPNVSLLPPLDNLLWRRERLIDIFGFDYTWEIYLPPARRRFGPYVMPILRGDRFIGRINPRLDRERGALVIEGLWLEKGSEEVLVSGAVPVSGAVLVNGEFTISGKGLSGRSDLSAQVKKALWDLARFIGAEELEFKLGS